MNSKKLYSSLLYLYPEKYRKAYGREMERVFSEVYRDEQIKGTPHFFFWLNTTSDLIISGIKQHLEELGQRGVKNYFKDTLSFNGFNLLGLIFLLPFLTLLSMDFISRIVQGDLFHYNRAFYNYLSQTFLYKYPAPFIWLLILPGLTLILNLSSILLNLKKRTHILSIGFLKRNFFSLLFISIGLFCLLILFGHDVIPCSINGVLDRGVNNFFTVVSYCRANA